MAHDHPAARTSGGRELRMNDNRFGTLELEITAVRLLDDGGRTVEVIDSGDPISISWQILPYALLTFGEVLVSASGLEFVYSQAPQAMKGTIMALWYLAVTTGNLWVLVANATVRNDAVLGAVANTGLSTDAFLMFFFAGFAFVTAVVFGAYAKRYREVDNYRSA